MNIDNSTGMTLFAGNISGASQAGHPSAPAANSEGGSIFQQLLSQMIPVTSQTGTADAAAAASGNTEPENSAGIGRTLSALISGGTLSRLKMVHEEGELPEAGDTCEIKGQAVKQQAKDVQSEAMEEVQSLMGGLANAFPASNIVKVLQENSIVDANTSKEAASAALAAPEVMENGRTDDGSLNASAESCGPKPMNETAKNHAATIAIENREAMMAKHKEAAAEKVEFKAELAEKRAINKKPGEETTNTDTSAALNLSQAAVSSSGAAEPDQAASTVESAEPYSQIREEILTRLEKNGPTEFKMQLEPEDLGQIDIKLKLSEGKLAIDILAADSRTQALLTNQVDKLIANLGLQNVRVEIVQVGQQMNYQPQDNNQNQGYAMNSAMDFSQRRQQEQYRHEFINNSSTVGGFSLRKSEAQADSAANRIGMNRYNYYRMNYSV